MRTKAMNASRVLALRRRLGLNQHDFWTPLGVTQSGGSRYETNRRIPGPMQLLIELAYGNDPQRVLKRIRRRRGFDRP